MKLTLTYSHIFLYIRNPKHSMTLSIMLIIFRKLVRKSKNVCCKIHQQDTGLVFILDKAFHPLSKELLQPHGNFSLRLIPSRCSKKCFEHLFASTAIQLYSTSCHSSCSLSLPTSRALQPRRLLLSPSIALDCFSLHL